MLLQNNGAVLTVNNRVRVFTDGKEKFASLLEDIRAATDFVHLEYFIWKDDGIGNDMRVALTERARAGVEVRLLCDGLGCAGLPRHFFDEFRSAGGKVAFFFPSYLRYLQPPVQLPESPEDCRHRREDRLYRRVQHRGRLPGPGPALGLLAGRRRPDTGQRGPCRRDSVLPGLELCGTEATGLSTVPRYFPGIAPTARESRSRSSPAGPDTEFNPVKEEYLKMIGIATESVYLQTPYFIPDESVIDALRIAALSGDRRPDHDARPAGPPLRLLGGDVVHPAAPRLAA